MRHEQTMNNMIDRWNASETPLYERLQEALGVIEKMHEERLKLQRRIHNQRLSNRENWETVEQRRNWLGSTTSRRMYISLLKRYKELRCAHGQSAKEDQ